jgi:type I restriction-modification system DNA methylase subunit
MSAMPEPHQTSLPPWLVNTLLDDGYIQGKIKNPGNQQSLCEWFTNLFSPEKLAQANESQLENSFIFPLLQELGWHCVPKQSLTVQGKMNVPDWCLALNPDDAESIKSESIKSTEYNAIVAICEAKEWKQKLDTGKAKRDENPHHQLQDYLSTLRIRFGFLTNGRLWRFYDTDRITAKKTYLEFDLQAISDLQDEDEKNTALSLFSLFFGRESYDRTDSQQTSRIEQTINASADFALEVEENLKAVIYGVNGEESIFELIGKAIHKGNVSASLDSVYESSVILIFRLLFIVYFEDKNRSLLNSHPSYQQHSLGMIYQQLREKNEGLYDGFYALKNLFKVLNEGAEDIDIPLFNGGLFDPVRAPLLLTPKVFTNGQLREILEKLLFKTKRGETLFDMRRDFKNMSVSHLGRIYEGLLEFRFEEAEEDAVYMEYTIADNNTRTEAYFDAYDAALIKKQRGFLSLRETPVKKGSIYLKSATNSRKSSASYYTPPSLSNRLVKAGIDHAINKAKEQKRKFSDIKILDNACGSGHFLVESLNYLTDIALTCLEEDVDLQSLVEHEKAKIAEQLQSANLPCDLDDAQILKRALLKRCIYGVDLNPFAVELARLSLWMDSFIFGTPLSFIEHHIQHGNALMGASIKELVSYTEDTVQNNLFVEDFRDRFNELLRVTNVLDDLRDTTAKEIQQSKKIWKTEIEPRLALLSRALSFICVRSILKAEGQVKEVDLLDKTPDLLSLLLAPHNDNDVQCLVKDYSDRYHFFHYEISFPEAFPGEEQNGFDAIIGNPPWDKAKFADPDFFPQYHSDYRNLSPLEQEKVKDRLLSSKHIKDAYQFVKRDMEIKNDYYYNMFPESRGAGDPNLFRYFIERNLDLIAPDGSLCYVIPGALMFEEGSTNLRKFIFTKFQMRFFHAFHNREGLFDIHRDTRFALTQIVKHVPEEDVNPIDTAFHILNPEELDDQDRCIPYALETLKRLSPDHWSMMELESGADLALLEKCYAKYKSLDEKWLDFRSELHMTADKRLFLEQQSRLRLPLYEGKMIWQYNHLYDNPRFWVDKNALHKNLFSKELSRMAADLEIPQNEARNHIDSIRHEHEFIRLGFRAIANSTNERTLIFSLLPKNCVAGHSLFLSVPKRYCLQEDGAVGVEEVSVLRLLFLMAWCNSIPADWLLRFMVEKNVSKTFVYRLPIPQPTDEEIRTNSDYHLITKNAALLMLAANWEDFKEIAPLFRIKRTDVPSSQKGLDKLRAKNDQTVARLYGISDEEFAHLLKSFKRMSTVRPEYVTIFGNISNP